MYMSDSAYQTGFGSRWEIGYAVEVPVVGKNDGVEPDLRIGSEVIPVQT
jgi:hypothetical protein